MSVRIIKWSSNARAPLVESFMNRPAFDPMAERAARRILDSIRKGGDFAVVRYARRFDGTALSPQTLRVTGEELSEAGSQVDDEFRKAVKEARKRIERFSKRAMRPSWQMSTPKGGRLGEQFMPLDRVGVYVPGGAAPLASTVLMTVALARVAGVKDIVVCTPCGRTGQVNPFVLYALKEAGATEVYRVGGVQAIGLMAYGTESVPKVQKIVGPGGNYVTAAKRLVYGNVALDLVAGPSEIAILASEAANPRHVAMDLLSQAEHGTGWEKALLVTPSRRLAIAVRHELDTLTRTLSRAKMIRRVMHHGMLLVVVESLASGMELCNRFAPEHLEIMLEDAGAWLKHVRAAGAVFLGRYTPESVGDFIAGPSHVLPTGGAAAMFSGLTVEDFRRRSSYMEFTREDLRAALPYIKAFGRVEGLDAHAASASIRFQRQGRHY